MSPAISQRRFQLWFYRVSHGQLLIRSPKSDTEATNYDLMFFGVVFMHLPTIFIGIEIVDANPDELQHIQKMKVPYGQMLRPYILSSANNRYWIAANSFETDENDLDIFDSKLDIKR